MNHYMTKKLTFAAGLLLCSLSFQAGFAQNKPAPKNLDIYLLIGQSNMSGVAPITPADTVTLKNAYLFNAEGQWEPAKNTETNGMNRYSNVIPKKDQKLGPSYSFARKLAQSSKRNIGIVANARGGTTVSWWQKGYEGEKDFNLYEGAIERAKAALAATPGAKIKAIIWHQGEGDNSKPSCTLYLERLNKLVTDLRTDLGDPNIPFIAGEVGQWNNRGLGVNPEIRRIKEVISNSDWVSSDGLTSIDLEKNDAHFDNRSQLMLGERYADKAFEIVYKKSKK